MAATLSQLRAEIRTCLVRGSTLPSRATLLRDTLRFHVATWTRRPPAQAEVHTYRVEIAGRQSDLRLRPHAGDFFVFHEVFAGGYYAIPEAVGSRITTIVDLGAHVGMTSLFLLEALPAARIVCVEPDADNARLLRQNLASFGDRALVIEAAVAARAGEASFEASGWSWERRLRTDTAAGGRRVRCLTIADIMREARLDAIDLLKMDVEGTEAALFETGD